MRPAELAFAHVDNLPAGAGWSRKRRRDAARSNYAAGAAGRAPAARYLRRVAARARGFRLAQTACRRGAVVHGIPICASLTDITLLAGDWG